MALIALLADDVTAATSIAFTPVAGTSSSATVVHLWLDKGIAGGEAHNIKGWPEVQVGGVWVTTGHPALDEGWFQAALVGGTGPVAESRFVVISGNAYRTVKASKPLDIDDLYGNCARYVSVRVTAPLDAPAGSFNWRFRVTSDVVSQSTDPGLPCGIVRGLGDSSRWEFVLAPVVTATGTPDSVVHVSWHSTNVLGVLHARGVIDDVTCNQNDGASSALSAGQSYKLLLSRGADHSVAPTSTKGAKATTGAAVIPAVPAGERAFAVINVAYHSGSSVINTSDITNLGVDGWARVTAGTGLNATVAALAVQLPGSFVRLTQTSTVALTASSTCRLWINSDATFSVVTASDAAPYLGSEWLATLTTSGSVVTAITDKRRFEDSAGKWLNLRKLGTESASTSLDAQAISVPHQIVAVRTTLGAPSIGASGNSTFDVNRRRAGTAVTIFTNQAGSVETRPKIAHEDTGDTAAFPELVSDGNAGDSYVLDQDSATTGGTQAVDGFVSLLWYPRP